MLTELPLLTLNDDKFGFKRLKLGRYEISIQGSRYHYCSPKVDSDNINTYDTLEVAIFKNGHWYHPYLSKKFKNKSYINKFEIGHTSVAGYMTKDDILDIINTLSED